MVFSTFQISPAVLLQPKREINEDIFNFCLLCPLVNNILKLKFILCYTNASDEKDLRGVDKNKGSFNIILTLHWWDCYLDWFWDSLFSYWRVYFLVFFNTLSCLLSIQVFRVGAIWTNQSHLHLPLTLLKLNKKSDYKLKCRFCSTNGTDTIAIAFSQKYILSVLFTVIFYYLATFPLYFFFANYDVFKTFPTLLIIREIQLDRLKSTQQTRHWTW